jgi:rubrerythrin
MLKTLDVFIEMETNAAETYKKLAHEANHEGPRALFAWLYNVEGTRLRRLAERRRGILHQHPELIERGAYQPRANTGLSKMGWGRTWFTKGNPLDILRYAIENEVRAMQFFRRKADTANDPMLKMIYNAAIAEQEDQIEYLGGQREALMQQMITQDAKRLTEMSA